MPEKRSTTIRLDEDGNLTPGSPNPYAWIRERLPLFADGEVKLSMGRPTRSLDQNAALWGLIYPQLHEGLKEAGVHDFHLMDEDGELMTIPITVNFLHLLMKRRHLTPDNPGEEPSTRGLSTTAFSEYIRAIRHDPLVEKHDIYIQTPNDPPPTAYE